MTKEELKQFIQKRGEQIKIKLLKSIQNYFFSICRFYLKNKGIIILIGGASGTGKSTLASYLSKKIISDVILSTDTIRHVTRNFMNEGKMPFLFVSTYEGHQLVTQNIEFKLKVRESYHK